MRHSNHPLFIALTAIAGSLVAVGCTNPGASAGRASGSLALSQDDAYLYAADTDNSIVAVVDTKTQAKVAEVAVGKSPVRVLVGSDDTIYVANRGDNSVSVIARGSWQELTRLKVGIEPMGLALTADGKQLLVTSSASKESPDYGTLTGFEVKTLQQVFEVPVGNEPRGVAVVNGNRALVSLSKQGAVVEVDLATKRVISNVGADLYDQANAARVNGSSSFGGISTFHARSTSDLVATPDGTRVFAPVVWAREDAIVVAPSAGGYYASGGPCSLGSVVTAGIVTVDVAATVTPRVDDLTACLSRGSGETITQDFPPSLLSAGPLPRSQPLQGTTVGVVDPTGTWLFVVNRESSNVAILPTNRRTGDNISFDSTGSSVRQTVGIGAGADGIALTRDGTVAYVYSQFEHRIERLASSGGAVVNTGTVAVVANDTLSPALALGRKLFFDATDTRISAETTRVACASCHVDGRDDGHVWQFPDGPRQTPTLAGRQLLATAPYHWSGEFKALNDFNQHTITQRMGGSGLDAASADKLDGWLNQLPGALAMMTPTSSDAVYRGRQIFETKAACASCHSGALLTDNSTDDVGTLNQSGANIDKGDVARAGFNVPSLLGLGRSAPYLHDGSIASLEERVARNPGDRHGVTSTLTADERRDLVAYLKSL